jgi:hypothetical protein
VSPAFDTDELSPPAGLVIIPPLLVDSDVPVHEREFDQRDIILADEE